MQKLRVVQLAMFAGALAFYAGAVSAQGQRMKVHDPAAIDWKPAPGMAPGAEYADLQGGLEMGARGADGLSITRFKFPDNYQIAPHSHPSDEHMTVISGTFMVGIGDKHERAGMQELKPGAHVIIPAGTVHYVQTSGSTVVQRTKTGAWSIIWANPADAPHHR